MAKRIEVRVTDDIDGSPDAQRVVFLHQGIAYEIDLSDVNLAAYNQFMATYVEHGRMLQSANGRPAKVELKQYESEVRAMPTRKPAKVDRLQNKAARAWWQAYGPELDLPAYNNRGRVPVKVMEAYQAHGGTAPKVKDTPADMTTATGEAVAKAVAARKPAKAAKTVPPATFQPADTPSGNGKVKKAAAPKKTARKAVKAATETVSV